MARIPTPRSLSQIIGSMAEVFLSRFGARGIKPGSPILGFIEAAAQSDARSAQDVFGLLEANDLNRATGVALDEHGRSVGLFRRGETVARGKVTIKDTSFVKKVGKVWQGAPAPIAGSPFIYVTGAATFPDSGSIYLARGLTTYEGPIPYTKTLHADGVWKLTLGSATQRFHAVGEAVTLAQGGNRQVPAGTVVSTPLNHVSESVSYATVRPVTLVDGEAELADVEVRCQKSGPTGNVPAGALTVASSPAFTGMAVENPNAISNGLPGEDDVAYRVRIQKFKQSRSRGATAGTASSIESAAYGVTASDESSAVLSAKLVERRQGPTTLYIDDGHGYEERTAGVPLEVLVDEALGGEDRFQLALGRPVAKAFVKTSMAAPFSLQSGAILAVQVGGVLSTHSFDAASFDDIRAASAHEVATSINSNPELLFAARTADDNTRVSIFAKSETNDDLTVVTPTEGDNANLSLGLSTRRVETVRLYKNDRPLYKDGLKARVRTNPQSSWGTLSENETLTINVDGTGEKDYRFTGLDFSSLGLPYTSVSETNSLVAWAAVVNAKVPGITAVVAGPVLELTSNLGTSARASISISPSSSLVTAGMFDPNAIDAVGRENDFYLDRNLGQVELTKPLAKGDRLTCGTLHTRAYIDSDEFTSVDLANAKWWVVVDGETDIVRTGLNASHSLRFTFDSIIKKVESLSGSTPVALFADLQAGDWMVWWDAAMAADTHVGALQSMVRISKVDPAGYWFEIDDPYVYTGVSSALAVSPSAIAFVRTTGRIQKVEANGTFSPATLAAHFSANVVGASAIVYESNWVRLYTNTFDNGSFTLVTQNVAASVVGFDDGVVENEPPHMACVESKNAEGDLPAFYFDHITAAEADGDMTLLKGAYGTSQWMGKWHRPLPTASYGNRFDGMTGDVTALGKGSLTYRARRYLTYPDASGSGFNGSRLSLASAFGLTAYDTLNVKLDGSEYAMDMFRRVKPEVSSAYGTASIRLTDVDTGNSIYSVFGSTFDFSDFALHMHPRCKMGSGATEVLWRLQQFGPVAARLTYAVADVPDQTAGVVVAPGDYYDVKVTLKSGPEKLDIAGPTRLHYSSVAAGNGASTTLRSVFSISSLQRVGTTVTVTTSLSAPAVDHKLQTGDTVYVVSSHLDFPAGPKSITRLSATQFTYTEAGNAVAAFNPGTAVKVSLNADEALWTGLVVGDAFAFGPTFDPAVQGSWLISAVSADAVTVVTPLGSVSNFIVAVPEGELHAFTTSSTTVAELVAALGQNEIVRPTALSTGGAVTATYNAWLASTGGSAWVSFVDGVNYIDSQSVSSSNFQFAMKNAASAGLAAPNDWANEELRLVPSTAKNIVDFLGVISVAPLGAAGASIQPVVRGGRVQISSSAIGSVGSVQVEGGSANDTAAAMLNGAPDLSGSRALLNVERQDGLGILGDSYVALQNSTRGQKSIPNVDLDIDKATKKATLVGSRAYAGSTTAPLAGGRWYVEKHGPFAAWVLANSGAAPSQDFRGTEGDWVRIPESAGGWETLLDPLGKERTPCKLADGRVLMCGGLSENGSSLLNSGYIYNPATNTTTVLSNNMPGDRVYHTATLLANGKVLVCGGWTALAGGTNRRVAYLYDPVLGTWATTTGQMVTERIGHTATLMSDGKVLIIGGDFTGQTYEVFDPATGTFSAGIQQFTYGHSQHTTTMVDLDVVVVAGGYGSASRIAAVEIFDYLTGAVTAAPPLTEPKAEHAAVKLHDGRVMFTGGSPAGGTISNAVCVYDHTARSMTALPSMSYTRAGHGAVVLNDGQVLVAGSEYDNPATAELFDPRFNTWSPTVAPLANTARALVLLDDGRALAGGGNAIMAFSLNAGLAKQNTGVFQVAAVYWDATHGYYAFWIENPDAVDESVGLAQAQFYTYDSLMPGDTLHTEKGSFTVDSLDEGSLDDFYVKERPGANITLAASPLTSAQPAAPARFIKKLDYIAPHPTLAATWVAATDQKHIKHLGSSTGTVVSPLNKLGFQTSAVVGSDGYTRNTGLISAVNRVMQGDESDRDTYPGILSAGSIVNITGPIVKRIRMGFDIRSRSGVVKPTIQSVAAATVNSSAVGSPVAISAVVAALQAVPGVEAVTVLSPVYGQGNDKIPVQSYEKALVLNPSTDITVNFIGE